jgi:hypothetical protein
MTNYSPGVAYVCDYGRLHHLLVGIASWRRFSALQVYVVDIGLTDAGRRAVTAVADGDVRFFQPANTAPVPDYLPTKQRAYAYLQKTLVGSHPVGDPVIFLDSDILVVHASFLNDIARVRAGELLATLSAWDSDFTWTYSPDSLPWLRAATGDSKLTLAYPVCNSGVWAARRADAELLATHWHARFRAALDAPGLRATLRPGTDIGDQEFLVPACGEIGVIWRRLHGSFNMQIHERRMPWAEGAAGHPLGGHVNEPLEAVRAIHYGCELDGSVNVEEGMIATLAIRHWIRRQYRECCEFVREKLGGCFPDLRSLQ